MSAQPTDPKAEAARLLALGHLAQLHQTATMLSVHLHQAWTAARYDGLGIGSALTRPATPLAKALNEAANDATQAAARLADAMAIVR